METPAYFDFLTVIFTFMYMYVFVPLTMLFASYILLAYVHGRIFGDEPVTPEVRFRRGIATLFPFVVSLYVVILSEVYRVPMQVELPFYVFLGSGLLIGYLFILWVARIPEDNELAATLSCLVASAIFFVFSTIFVVSRSFEVLSFVFGLLFGIFIYIIRYGMGDLLMHTASTNRFVSRVFRPMGNAVSRMRQSLGRNRRDAQPDLPPVEPDQLP